MYTRLLNVYSDFSRFFARFFPLLLLLLLRRVKFVSSPACTQAHTQAFSFVLSFLSHCQVSHRFSSEFSVHHSFFVSRKLELARRPLYTASHCSLCLSSVSISPRSVLFFLSPLSISLFSLSLPSFLFRILFRFPHRYAIVRQL